MQLMLLMTRMELSQDERDKVIEVLVQHMDMPKEDKMATVDSLITLMTESKTKADFLKKLETS